MRELIDFHWIVHALIMFAHHINHECAYYPEFDDLTDEHGTKKTLKHNNKCQFEYLKE